MGEQQQADSPNMVVRVRQTRWLSTGEEGHHRQQEEVVDRR